MTVINSTAARFMASNLLEGASSITVSSENSSFPKANLYDKDRSNPFLFTGRFTIDSTNNSFYINDGSDLTATITSAEYTTGSALATAIQTALNTVSTNFTVTFLNGTFTVSRSSNWTLRLSSTSNAIWDTIGFTGASDVSIASSTSSDNVVVHYPNETILIDFGYAAQIDFCGMISSLENDFLISESGTITIQANNINEFTSPPISETPSFNSLGCFNFFDDVDSNYRYWKITIQDRQNTGNIGIGHLHLGPVDYLSNANRNFNIGFNHSKIDPSIGNVGETGRKFFNVKTKINSFSDLNFSYVQVEDKYILERLFNEVGINTPFFIGLDPTVCFSRDISDFTKFVYLNSEPIFSSVIYDYFNASISVSEAM